MIQLLLTGSLAPLLLRLGLAVIFIFHGMGKVSGPDAEWGTNWASAQTSLPDSLRSSKPQQLAVAWGELVGGVALGLGLLTRLAALGVIGLMAGAIATVTGANGFDVTKHGYEYNFAVIVMATVLVVTGGGPFSLDWLFRHFWRGRKAEAAG